MFSPPYFTEFVFINVLKKKKNQISAAVCINFCTDRGLAQSSVEKKKKKKK